MGHEAQVRRHLRRALGDAGQDVQKEGVDLPRVGLARDGQHAVKAHVRGYAPLQLAGPLRVPAEEGEEARARACRALAAVEGQALQLKVQALKVKDEVLRPHAGALAQGRGLGGLIVRVGEHRRVLLRADEVREGLYDVQEQPADLLHGVPVGDEVAVVVHEAARGAQVDDAAGTGAVLAPGADVGHDVVPQLLFIALCGLIVDDGEVFPELRHLLGRDGKAQGPLVLRQGEPEPVPGRELVVRGEDLLHPLRGVARAERVFVPVLFHGRHSKTQEI